MDVDDNEVQDQDQDQNQNHDTESLTSLRVEDAEAAPPTTRTMNAQHDGPDADAAADADNADYTTDNDDNKQETKKDRQARVLFALSKVSAKYIKVAKKRKKKDTEEIAKKTMHKNDDSDGDSGGDATNEENEETEEEKNKTVARQFRLLQEAKRMAWQTNNNDNDIRTQANTTKRGLGGPQQPTRVPPQDCHHPERPQHYLTVHVQVPHEKLLRKIHNGWKSITYWLPISKSTGTWKSSVMQVRVGI